ncbi:hypothetical protein DL767_010819 [Monosporascus sp. MG133]|nr:hypothetical protein DL767_010819 [Monosporascus sp. MG133]
MASGDSDVAGTKNVVVTGGASGLGLAMTRHFAAQGYRVTILDVDEESGFAVETEVSQQHPRAAVAFKKCDISSWQNQASAFKEAHQQAGRIDVVMANAGISEQGKSNLAALDEDEPSEPRLRILDVNLRGTIYTVKLAMHYMRKNKPDVATGSRGSIICTASNAGLYPFPTSPLYAVSKFGIVGLVRSLARPLESTGIQINALAPAVLETGIAPSKDLFKHMVVTPISTLTRGIAQFIENPGITGEVAEIHGENVTLRPPHEFVDEDSRANVEMFWKLGTHFRGLFIFDCVLGVGLTSHKFINPGRRLWYPLIFAALTLCIAIWDRRPLSPAVNGRAILLVVLNSPAPDWRMGPESY